MHRARALGTRISLRPIDALSVDLIGYICAGQRFPGRVLDTIRRLPEADRISLSKRRFGRFLSNEDLCRAGLEALATYQTSLYPHIERARGITEAAISDELTAHGIDFVRPKQSKLIKELESNEDALVGDIDLMVSAQNLDTTESIMTRLGFDKSLVVRKGRVTRILEAHINDLEASIPMYGQLMPYSRLSHMPRVTTSDLTSGLTLRSFLFTERRGEAYFLDSVDLHYDLVPFSPLICDLDSNRPEPAFAFEHAGDDRTLSDLAFAFYSAIHLYSDAVLQREANWKLLTNFALLTTHSKHLVADLALLSARWPSMEASICAALNLAALVSPHGAAAATPHSTFFRNPNYGALEPYFFPNPQSWHWSAGEPR